MEERLVLIRLEKYRAGMQAFSPGIRTIGTGVAPFDSSPIGSGRTLALGRSLLINDSSEYETTRHRLRAERYHQKNSIRLIQVLYNFSLTAI